MHTTSKQLNSSWKHSQHNNKKVFDLISSIAFEIVVGWPVPSQRFLGLGVPRIFFPNIFQQSATKKSYFCEKTRATGTESMNGVRRVYVRHFPLKNPILVQQELGEHQNDHIDIFHVYNQAWKLRQFSTGETFKAHYRIHQSIHGFDSYGKYTEHIQPKNKKLNDFGCIFQLCNHVEQGCVDYLICELELLLDRRYYFNTKNLNIDIHTIFI